MKRFLPVLLGVALASGSVAASGHLSLRDAGRVKAKSERKANGLQKNVAISNYKPIPYVMAPERFETRAEAETHQEQRLLSYRTSTWEDGVFRHEEIYHCLYDEYGFPSQRVRNDGFVTNYKYTWKVPGKIWSERTIQEERDGHEVSKQTISREFYANGSVSKQTDSYGNTFEYNEDGYLVKRCDSYGYWNAYHYFPLANRWYESIFNAWQRREVVISDNSVEMTDMQLVGDKWYPGSRNVEYFSEDGIQIGGFQEHYNIEGDNVNVVYSYGTKRYQVKGDGEIAYIEENWDSDKREWYPSNKRVWSLNYNDSPWIYTPGGVHYEKTYSYDIDTSSWVLDWSDTYTWITPKVLKCEYYGDGETSESYYMAGLEDEEGGNGLTGISYDVTTGDFAYSVSPAGEDVEYYYICKADGSVLHKFRQEYDKWQEWNGTEWVKCSGTIKVAQDSDDQFVITFDSEGRMTRFDSYEDGEMDYYELYSYAADGGVFFTTYERNEAGNYLKHTEEYYLRNAAGELVEEWDKYYDEDGTLNSGYRRVFKTPKHYQNFDLQDGVWVAMDWYREPDYIEGPDGLTTNIYYTVDEQGNATPTYKDVYKNAYNESNESYENYNEHWEWDTDLNDWRGVNRSESRMVPYPDFECIMPDDPVALGDEYFVSKNPMSSSNATNRRISMYRQQEWDAYTKSWRTVYGQGYDFETPDAFTFVATPYMPEQMMSYVAKVDQDRRIVSLNERSWEYDAEGRLAKYSVVTNNEPNVTVTTEYIWGDVPVLGSGVADIVGDDARTVVAVYGLNGVEVKADTLPAGIYVVKYSDGTTRKIIMK